MALKLNLCESDGGNDTIASGCSFFTTIHICVKSTRTLNEKYVSHDYHLIRINYRF